ncbi:hypothetical protein MJO01_23715, partial [Salmonella enterica subsp. enterica serovar Anatum]|nr:hypothetical protein [Salmonella enterica subsp. enterica serovar Anatum]
SSKGEFYVTCKTFNITATDADGQINTIKGQLDLNMDKREPKVGTFGESEKTAMAAVIKETSRKRRQMLSASIRKLQ